VYRAIAASFLALSFFCVRAAAEEISLKDGTKIVGHLVAVTADKLEVETSYGKIQLKRIDILTISFPENGAASSNVAAGTAPTAAAAAEPKIDESLNGLLYTNRTGKFTLTLPPDWVISTDIHKAPETLAALASRDKLRFLLVMQEDYPGSLESYKELTMLGARRSLGNFEELSQSSASIDGKPALVIFYRGTLQKGSSLPVEFVSAIMQSGKTFTKVSAWCVEPLFHDMQPAFEKVLNSYRSTGGQATAAIAKP
jgi:hypothetical protein